MWMLKVLVGRCCSHGLTGCVRAVALVRLATSQHSRQVFDSRSSMLRTGGIAAKIKGVLNDAGGRGIPEARSGRSDDESDVATESR